MHRKTSYLTALFFVIVLGRPAPLAAQFARSAIAPTLAWDDQRESTDAGDHRARRRQLSERAHKGAVIGVALGGITGVILGARHHCNVNCTNGGPLFGAIIWGSVGGFTGGVLGALIAGLSGGDNLERTSTLSPDTRTRVAGAQFFVAPTDRGNSLTIGVHLTRASASPRG